MSTRDEDFSCIFAEVADSEMLVVFPHSLISKRFMLVLMNTAGRSLNRYSVTLTGLDSSRYQHKANADDNDEEEAHARLLSEEERYKLCTRLEIVCQHKNCSRKNIIDSPICPGKVGLCTGC